MIEDGEHWFFDYYDGGEEGDEEEEKCIISSCYRWRATEVYYKEDEWIEMESRLVIRL